MTPDQPPRWIEDLTLGIIEEYKKGLIGGHREWLTKKSAIEREEWYIKENDKIIADYDSDVITLEEMVCRIQKLADEMRKSR
jgi:hypothetical protein